MSHLLDLAGALSDPADAMTRLAAGNIYEVYEQYFDPLRGAHLRLLELGVHRGDSLKTWGAYFPDGIIVGTDIRNPGTDFAGYPNVRFEIADQSDGGRLAEISAAHAPDGWDIIIDDASHVGALTLASYRALFPFLKPGGLYCVEDWGTAYWSDWPDGAAFRDHEPSCDGRIRSHDYGMAGFVKYLTDEVMNSGIRDTMAAPLTRPDRLEFLHVYKPAVIMKKARSLSEDRTAEVA